MTWFDDGTGAFPLEMARLGNVGDPRRETPDRKAVLERIPKDDPASRGADLLRTRQTTDALNILGPAARSRTPDFRSLANLAHLHASRGEWSEAKLYHEAALTDAEFPKDLSPWLKRIETDYYPRWLKLRAAEAEHRRPPEDDDLFPLFEKQPPADAIAIVQQLVLWSPEDSRLYWLLGELYARAGQWRQAERVFDSLAAEGRQQSNRPKLMARRAEVKREVVKLDTPIEPPPDTRVWYEKLGLDRTRLSLVIAAAAVIGTMLMRYQLRRWFRRVR